MTLRIADDDRGWEISVPLEHHVLEALQVQMARIPINYDEPSPRFCIHLAEKISAVILESLDTDLKPPTDAQVSFALAIARDLNVSLPGEALLYRGAMSDFLTRFAPTFNSRHGRKT